MFEVMSARKAADLIHDGDVVAFNGMVCMGLRSVFFRRWSSVSGRPARRGACGIWPLPVSMVPTGLLNCRA